MQNLSKEQKLRFEELENISNNRNTDILNVAVEEWGLYNNSFLVCRWWDCETSIEDITEYYQLLRLANNIEYFEDVELFAADIENDELKLYNEAMSIEDTFIQYENYYHLDDNEKESLTFLMDCQGYTMSVALDKIEDCYYYEASSYADLAEQFIEEGLLGEDVLNLWKSNWHYIDIEAIGRDLQFDYIEHNGKYFRCD